MRRTILRGRVERASVDLPLHEVVCDRQPQGAEALCFAWASGAEERWTFGEVARASRALADDLATAGIAPQAGDRVAVVLPQCPLAPAVHLALSRLGAVSVPLSPLFGPDGLAPRIAASGARLSVVHRSRAVAMREAAPALPAWVVEGRMEERMPRGLTAAPAPAALRVPASMHPGEAPGEAPMSIIFTSGTTAAPKGVVLPHRVIPGRLAGFLLAHPGFGRGGHAGAGAGNRFWSPADWAWIGGLHDALLAPWCLGAPVFAFERSGPFDTHRAAALLEAHRVRNAFLPPTALRLWMRSGAPGVGLRTLHTAGEPLPAPVHAWAAKAFAPALPREVYGLTECAFLLVNGDAAPGTTGRAAPGVDLALDAEGGLLVRRGAPTMMLGYLDAGPGAVGGIVLPLDPDGWLATADLAAQDAEGRFRVLGRADDVVKTAGYRVAPREVEQELLRHPAVLEAAVAGVPDEVKGAALKAWVVVAPGFAADAALGEALRAQVRERLAAHEVPREVVFVAELPRTTTGKVRRGALRMGGPGFAPSGQERKP